MIKLDIISPEHRLFSGEVELVRLPGSAGAFTVLTGHAPIVSSLVRGVVSYLTAPAAEEHQLRITGGFVEVSDNRATLCVEEDPDGPSDAAQGTGTGYAAQGAGATGIGKEAKS